MGVITYMLLFGRPPFTAQQEDELYELIQRGQVDFNVASTSTTGDLNDAVDDPKQAVKGAKKRPVRGGLDKNNHKDSDKDISNNDNNIRKQNAAAAAPQRPRDKPIAAAGVANVAGLTARDGKKSAAASSSSSSSSSSSASSRVEVSDSAKSLIQGMLTVDPAYRLTASEVLHHPWTQVQLKNCISMVYFVFFCLFLCFVLFCFLFFLPFWR